MPDGSSNKVLEDKVAFVVGGCGLIGKAITQAFFEAGATPIILDIDTTTGNQYASKYREHGRLNSQFIELDCSKLETLDDSFCKIIEDVGCPDIFVNSSYPKTEDYGSNTFADVTFESFRQNIDIHMNSSGWLARVVAQEMKKRKIRGSIVQLGSIYGVVGQNMSVYEGTEGKENISYTMIKGGILSLTRLMASYYGSYGIRVNTICPGPIDGPFPGIADQMSSKLRENIVNNIPLGRQGTPEDVAPLVVFVASDQASFITGSTIMVDGGWSAI